MALKDWKKDKKTYGGKHYMYFIENQKQTHIYIDKFKGNKFWKMYVQVYGISKILERDFKTKSQALKFAKDYMKKH